MKIYGNQAENPAICPTEVKCDRYAAAGGSDHYARVKNACSTCELLPTKLDGGKSSKALARTAEKVMRLRYKQKAGYPVPPDGMTNIQFQGLWVVEELFEQEQVRMAVKTQKALFASLGIKDG